MTVAEEKFQVIVIGAGLAGSAAAYRLAKAGIEVMVVERGSEPGVKNMTGGRIYTHALEKLMPDEWAEAPFEREITREIIMMMTPENSMSVDSLFPTMNQQSYSVLRAKFDAWLASKAEEEGAMIIPGTTVDGLIIRDGKVCGIKTGEEELEADLVISAEGVNSLLAERAGLIKPVDLQRILPLVSSMYTSSLKKSSMIVSIQKVEKVQPFCAPVIVRKGVSGGAFLYSNKDSISVGLVLDSIGWKKSEAAISRFCRGI